ncbi:amidohydrolase family protein [Nitratireductor sp. XY-223]|uniref:amidohydrolase family protein n=1 Tax=Nitratireductor sp. XY-223 TaxID=2561926 RepID=UPI0010AA8493|nr:amidohydrolase family protein [Nitratireductor sp. XY-223]
MRICDPHIHLWDLSTGLYPGLETPSVGFIGSNAPICRDYLLAEYLAEAGEGLNVVAAVHVEAFPTDPLAEVAHVQKMADASPTPLAIVGNADLTSPDVGGLLDRMRAHSALRGIRHVVNLHDDPALSYVQTDYLSDPDFARGLHELETRELSFDLQLYPHQVEAAVRVFSGLDNLSVIVNHAGMWCDRTPSGWTAWKAALRRLADLPNVTMKISGLGMFDRAFTIESLRPLVSECLEVFGPDRAMFASNFPVDKLFSDFSTLWSSFDAITADLPRDSRHALFEANARRIYRI